MDDVRVSRRVTIPARELRFRFSRSGGPGGQNVNVRETRVEVVFDLARSPSVPESLRARALERLASRLDGAGRLRVVASGERTQAANRARAVERLRALVAEALRPSPPARRPTKPTRAATERRLRAKRVRSVTKRLRSAPRADAE